MTKESTMNDARSTLGAELAAARPATSDAIKSNYKESVERAGAEHDRFYAVKLMDRARAYGLKIPPEYRDEGVNEIGQMETFTVRVAPSCIDIEYPTLNRYDFVSTQTAAFLLGVTCERAVQMAESQKAIAVTHAWAPLHTGGTINRLAWPLAQFVDVSKRVFEVDGTLAARYWMYRTKTRGTQLQSLAAALMEV